MRVIVSTLLVGLMFPFSIGFSQDSKIDAGECQFGLLDGKEQSYVIKNGVKEPVKYCIELTEPIAGSRSVSGNNGVDLFSNYIRLIYTYGASIIGIVCVLVIVVSGVQFSMAGFNETFKNQARDRILQALLSLILLFSSALILHTINPGFFFAA